MQECMYILLACTYTLTHQWWCWKNQRERCEKILISKGSRGKKPGGPSVHIISSIPYLKKWILVIHSQYYKQCDGIGTLCGKYDLTCLASYTPSSLPTKWVWGYLGIGLFVWFFVCFFPVQTICTWIAYNQSVCVVVVNLNFFLLAHRPSECANPPVQRHH